MARSHTSVIFIFTLRRHCGHALDAPQGARTMANLFNDLYNLLKSLLTCFNKMDHAGEMNRLLPRGGSTTDARDNTLNNFIMHTHAHADICAHLARTRSCVYLHSFLSCPLVSRTVCRVSCSSGSADQSL